MVPAGTVLIRQGNPMRKSSPDSGSWRKAIEVPGLGALNKDGSAAVDSVPCRSAGNCSAGGLYTNGSGRIQPFVVSQA